MNTVSMNTVSMNTVVIIGQFLAFVFFALAALKITLRPARTFERVTRFILGSFIGLLAINSFFNFMRSIGVSDFMEQYEGYMEILVFPLALFSLYTMRNDLSRRQLQKMRQEDQLKATLLDSVEDVVLLHNFDGQMVYMNRSAREKLGYDKTALSSIKILDILESKSPEQATERIETIRHDHFATFESALQPKKGPSIPVEVNARIVEYEDTPHILGVARDVSERYKLEQERIALDARLQQAQKMESLGTLAGGIAHDFNNILVPILGYSDLLVDAFDKNSKEYDSANKILQAAERARDIVKQILSFSRAKKETESAHPVFIHQVIKEVLELVKEVLPTSATLTQNVSSCAPVISTSSQIHRICLNLITNAYQALGGHSGTVTVQLKEFARSEFAPSNNGADAINPHWVELRVSDTGQGMTEEQQQRIFEPYFTTKQEGFGTGLGLAVVDGIIREIGGKIKVESQKDVGTTFTVLLPGAHEPHVSEVPPGLQLESASGNLMVVDDEEVVGTYLKEILENAGYEVSLFFDSIAALAAFHEEPNRWQVILSDFTMPNLTGDELAEAVRRINKNVGFILCSGYSGHLDEASYRRLQIDGFVLKPFRPRELLSKVQKTLLLKGLSN